MTKKIETKTTSKSFIRAMLLFILLIGIFLTPKSTSAITVPPPQKTVLHVSGDYNFPPYEYLDENGDPTGYNVDLIKAVAAVMGVDVEVTLRPWAEVRQAIETNEIDAIIGMFYSETRDQEVDFSIPHTIVYHAIFTRGGNTAIRSLDDLKGKEVIVQQGDIMHDYVLENNLTDQIITVETPEEALRLLAVGQHDGALIGKTQGLFLINEYKLSNIRSVGDPFYPTEYSFAVKEGDTETLALLNEGLNILKATGEYQEIYKKWLGILDPPGITVNAAFKYGFIIFLPVALLLIILGIWSWSLREQIAEITQALETEDAEKTLGVLQRRRIWLPITGLFTLLALLIWANEIWELPSLLFRTSETPINWQEALIESLAIFGVGALTLISFTRISKARHEIERALHDSEKRYHRLFEDAILGIFQSTPDGKIITVNPAYAQMFGYASPDELMAMVKDAARDIYVNPELRPKRVQRILESATPVHAENQYKRKDGSVFTGNLHAWTVKDKKGNVLYLEGFVEDITKRKKAEQAQQKYAERLRTLHAIDGAILAAWSPEEIAQASLRHIRKLIPCWGTTIIMFNPDLSKARLFAVNIKGEIRTEAQTGLELENIPNIEALQSGQVLIENDILDSIQPQSVVQYVQSANVRSYLAAPLIAHGKLIGLLGLGAETPNAFTPEHIEIAHEVANQIAVALRQAQLHIDLETERQRLHTLVEYLPQGILLLDKNKRIRLINPAAQNCLPYLTESKVGEILTHVADHTIEEILTPPAEGLWHELEIQDSPCQIITIAGRLIGTSSKIEGWAIVMQNVTKEREIQQRVQHQERLAVVGQMAGGIAHDFNNFLTTIMLYAQIPLRQPGLESNLTHAFETILGESQKAAQLIQQILDFSRRTPIAAAPLDLRSFIKEIVKILSHTIPENIILTFKADTGSYIANADPTRIQQALMNLLVNARDAMPKGGKVHLTLSHAEKKQPNEKMLTEMPPGDWICITVSDAGTGMAPEVMGHLFEPFFTTKSPGEGTGLGLAQVYGIVKQHAGYIGVETTSQQGTTFRIYLPTYVDDKEANHQKEIAPLPEGRGETILLVEDKQELRILAQELLESLGYQVLTADNGQKALERYHEVNHVDLLLTDLIMPTIGGKELILMLRKENPKLKVIVMTGYGVDDEISAMAEREELDIIQKPFDAHYLAKKVRESFEID